MRGLGQVGEESAAGEGSARRVVEEEEEEEEMRELLEEEMEMNSQEREWRISRAKARKVLGLSYGFMGPGLTPRTVMEEEEEEKGGFLEEDEEEGWVEDWVEPRGEEVGDVPTGLGDGGMLLPLAYKP